MSNHHPLEKFFLDSRLNRIDSVLAGRTSSISVVLDGVQNPHNISAVLRSADAFGIQNIYLVGESFTYSRGISLGSERWLTLHKFETAEECLAALREKELSAVLLQAEELTKQGGGSSLSIEKLPFDRKLALVFGNEHRGVSEAFQKSSPIYAHIPMVGFVESLNISVAAAITFFSAYISGRPNMEDAERLALRDSWLVKDLRGGEQILKRIEALGEEER